MRGILLSFSLILLLVSANAFALDAKDWNCENINYLYKNQKVECFHGETITFDEVHSAIEKYVLDKDNSNFFKLFNSTQFQGISHLSFFFISHSGVVRSYEIHPFHHKSEAFWATTFGAARKFFKSTFLVIHKF